MKKLAIVLAALLLACVFVGCDVLGSKALIGTWKYQYGEGDNYSTWTFNDDGTFDWKEGVNIDSGKWVYDDVNLTISDFKSSYDGVWALDFVSGTEVELTLVSFADPTFQNNAQRLKDGESLTLTKVVEDAE